jgi:hypothetical protein
MTGSIYKINLKRAIVAAKTEEGYSIFELLSQEDINVGDSVEWEDDTGHGDQMLINHTKRKKYIVYFQNHQVPLHLIDSQIRLK